MLFLQDPISDLISVRQRNGISATSSLRILAFEPGLYVARIGDNVHDDHNFRGLVVKLGPQFDMGTLAPGENGLTMDSFRVSIGHCSQFAVHEVKGDRSISKNCSLSPSRDLSLLVPVSGWGWKIAFAGTDCCVWERE